MISAEIRNRDKSSFMEFQHHNTTLVAVPHGEKGELCVTSDRPATLVIEAGGENVLVQALTPPLTVVDLSTLNQPHVPERTIGGFLPSFEFGPFKHVKRPKIRQRLFAFTAIVKAGKPEDYATAETLASYRFHLLCLVDFHWARAIELGANGDPTAAEGTCPQCKEVSDVLKRAWRFET